MYKNIDITGIILETDRLILRPWSIVDLNDFYEYASIAGVGEMAGWQHHESKSKSAEILNTFIEGKSTFAIEFSGKCIGSIGLHKYNEDVYTEFCEKYGVELGFVLSKCYWGRGIMPEALMAVIHFLFNVEKMDFITCASFLHNKQSERVQHKCGFLDYATGTYFTSMGTEEDCIYRVIIKQMN